MQGMDSNTGCCMDSRLSALAVAFMVVLAAPVGAADKCRMSGVAQLPVTMRRSSPMVAAKINGQDVKFIVDSGSFYSMISPASAEALHLPQTLAPDGLMIKGVGGKTQPMMANVRDFGLGGGVVNNMEFLVTGSSFGEAVGLMGQNILAFVDLELDLGGGAIRMMRAENCKDENKVYWIKPGEKFSSLAIQPITKYESHIVGSAYLNGKKIRVLFDTGASSSILGLHAAERAGIKTTSPGVVPSGSIRGNGSRMVPTWIAPFQSFKIGEEEIRDTHLRVGDLDLGEIDMLVGADFFLSHRIYVSYSANKLLFTYRGGPVFDLGRGGNAESIDGEAIADTREPSTAEGYSRRGAAYASRGDLPRAIADLTRAVELDPREPEYFYQRGMFYQNSGQRPLALADMDQVISLKTDHQAARLARAALRLQRMQATGNGTMDDVIADLDVARSTAARDADIHYDIAGLYAGIGAQEQAMAEFDLWLELHRDDSRAPDAHAAACRARALLGQELDKAMADCNRAVQDRNGVPLPLEDRGLLHVRMRNFDKAIADLDKVIVVQPRNAWALYARGLAKLGKGRKAEGEADIAAAKAANPRAVSNAIARGFVP